MIWMIFVLKTGDGTTDKTGERNYMIFNNESNEIIENDEDGSKNEFNETHERSEPGEDENEEYEISKICMNCGDFIQATSDYSNNFGICLRESEFEEYIDEMFDNNDFSGCIEHYNAKRFNGDIDSCEHFYVPEEANFRIYLLKTISAYKNHKKWVNPLADELFRTDSNQKTRRLITFILDTLRSQYEDDLALEALQSLLMRRKFSPKMKNRINETISWIYERRTREFKSEFWFRPVPDWVDNEDN